MSNTEPTERNAELLDYWSVVRRRRWLLVTAFVGALVLTVVFTYRQVPLYRATSSLIVEPSIPELASLSGQTPTALIQQFYQTQYEVIRSGSVLKKLFAAGELARDPAFAGHPDPLRVLRERVGVKPVPDSRLVRLSIDHERREKAIELADMLARVYIDHDTLDRQMTSRSAFDWLSGQIDVLKAKVEESEKALLDYGAQEDLVSLERRQILLEDSLSSLNLKHSEASSRTLELTTTLTEVARLKEEPELVESLPQILENTVVVALKQELSTLDVELARISKRYKPKHPKVVSLQSQVALVKERLASEVDKIYKAVEIEHRLAKANENSLKNSLDQTKQEAMRVAQRAVTYRVLEREAQSNRQMYDVLLQKLREADVSGNLSGGNIRVLDPANADLEPHSPRVALNLIVGALAGLVAGVGLCFLVEHLDTSLEDEDDIRFYLKQPVLGLVPRQKGKVDLVDDKSDTLLRAYASIRTRLQLLARNAPLRTLLVTSAARNEGKTVSAMALGLVFARTGSRVLMVDADLVQAALGKRLRVPQAPGVADILLQRAELKETIRPSEHQNLHVLPAGDCPPDSLELLGSPQILELLQDAQRLYDLVIVDSPPVGAALDVGFVGAAVGGVVVVARARATSRNLVRKALDHLQGSGSRVLGVVLTAAEISSDSLGYDYYYYHDRSGTAPQGSKTST